MTLRILSVLLVASLAISACDGLFQEGDTIIENPTDPTVCGDAICSVGETAVNCPADCTPAPVQFTIGGGCGARPGTCMIFCNDDSSPPENIRGAAFEFFQGQVSLGTRQTSGEQVDFTVDTPGSYTVRHRVTATDGGTRDTTYPVTVVGNGFGGCL